MFEEFYSRIVGNQEVGFSDKDLAFKYFVVYARFEYALKRAGYIEPNSDPIRIGYQKFGDEFNDVFQEMLIDDDHLKREADYLILDPPRKHVAMNGNLSWNDNPPTGRTSLEVLHRIVARIRNNFFHGEKFNVFLSESRRRNVRLLNGGLLVIEKMLDCSEDTKDIFYRGY